MLAGLEDSDRDVRIICCETIAKHKFPDSAQKLMKVLSSDTEIDVGLAAAKAFGEFKEDQAVVAALGTALDSNDPALQYRAVQSLASDGKTTTIMSAPRANSQREQSARAHDCVQDQEIVLEPSITSLAACCLQ